MKNQIDAKAGQSIAKPELLWAHYRCKWTIVLSLTWPVFQTLSADTWYAQYTQQKWEGNSRVLAYFTPLAQQKYYFIKFCICPLLFVFIPVYYFHFFPQLARWLSPRACIYVGGNRIGKVIEKLSCRSGWFVEPVHALIHPAAPPHK